MRICLEEKCEKLKSEKEEESSRNKFLKQDMEQLELNITQALKEKEKCMQELQEAHKAHLLEKKKVWELEKKELEENLKEEQKQKEARKQVSLREEKFKEMENFK